MAKKIKAGLGPPLVKSMRQINLNQKANLIFYQILFLGLSFLATIIFIFIKLLPSAIAAVRSLAGRLEMACGCAHHFIFANHPLIFSGIIILTLGIFSFLILFLFKIIHLNLTTAKFVKSQLKNQKPQLSLKLKSVAEKLKLNDRLVEIVSEQPMVFCFGFIKPKICLSSALVKELTARELMAVLSHERHHALVGEPRRLFMVKVINKVCFFFPGLNFLTKQYLIFSELAADEKAIARLKSQIPLARALYKIIKIKENKIIQGHLALSFFGLITEERINKLADRRYRLPLRIFSRYFVSALLLLLTLPVFFVLFSPLDAPSYSYGANVNSCPLAEIQASSRQCLALPASQECQNSYRSPMTDCE